MGSKVKLSDYVASFLAEAGVEHVFGLTGGAVMHLFDSVAKSKKITPIFVHHEQSAAMAAEAYARITNNLGVAMVTQGPGATNTLTGLCCAWLDSIPCLFFSGQARRSLAAYGKPVRQVMPQAIDIVSLVKPITKYAVMIQDPQMIRYELEKALYLAKKGRPGPVWIDVPLDCQWVPIDPDSLPRFEPPVEATPPLSSSEEIEKCLIWIEEAQRPLILAGNGIHLGHAENEFRQLLQELPIPFISSWNASDLLPTDHELYVGRPGIFGQRGANLAIQNCDLLICLGSHLAVGITTQMCDAFSRESRKIMVNIDPTELGFRTIPVDLPIQADIKNFLQTALAKLKKSPRKLQSQAWKKKCQDYHQKYNSIPKDWYEEKIWVNPYVFLDVLSGEMGNNDVIVVDGGGSITEIGPQAVRVKEGQRFIISAGLSTMGTLPESIGACFANNKGQTIFLCGDGSMQLNIQELQTIVHHQLPIKMFILNNEGYLLMRLSQEDFFDQYYVGSSEESGLSMPDFSKVAEAYGVKAVRIQNHAELREKIKWTLGQPGPVLCEIMAAKNHPIHPRMGFDRRPDGSPIPRPMEDMYPFLDREEFASNMFVKPWQTK